MYGKINDNLTSTTPKINNLTREPNHTPLPQGHAALSRERPRSIHLLDQPQHPRHHCLACGRLDGESMRHTFLHRHRHARSRGARRRLARRPFVRVAFRIQQRQRAAAALLQRGVVVRLGELPRLVAEESQDVAHRAEAGQRACRQRHHLGAEAAHIARCELEEPLRGEARQQPHQAGGAGEEEDGGGRPPRRRRLRLRPD
mmetsp:Transcript_45401/g.146121  ORF Transcript_45401/g.146121 Transcript_45401/m.146121 type:complete len:201 (-) Transcript_45401:486-1088(-)